jgi:predicted ATPase
MKLTHVGISLFRSIGEEFVTIDLTKKINVLVGANNCGKSNVLSALCSFGQKTDNEIDRHKRAKDSYPCFWATGTATQSDHALLQQLGKIRIGWQPMLDDEQILENPFYKIDWTEFAPYWDSQNPSSGYRGHPTTVQVRNEQTREAMLLWSKLKKLYPPTAKIPQFRQIQEGDEYGVTGKGIIKLLGRWQHPKIGQDAEQDRFLKVQGLLRQLLQLPAITIEVVHDNTQILVGNGDLRLPLESYGTGIHELIILAIAVLSHEKALVCIEEPEIHLHPLLQKRFLEFLRKETSNRYVITTHSPALIAPADDVAVTHLWLENGVTKSRVIETSADSLRALRDLGVEASDLLQANSVIWVEGPSDRIYLNRWLHLLYPELREGIDYSIMFYGGRLLSHVSMEREESDEVDDMVRLLRINQHSAILIDSDRRSSADPLNATKQRVGAECEKSSVLCWVTDGREIENYLPIEAISAAYEEFTGSKPALSFSAFDSIEDALAGALSASWKRANYYDNAKPQMARRIILHITTENIPAAVKAWLDKLVEVIRHKV